MAYFHQIYTQIWHPETRRSHLSTIYGCLRGPRSLEAVRGHPADSSDLRPLRDPHMVLKWLPLVSGCQICVYIWWKYAIKETYLRKRDNDFFSKYPSKTQTINQFFTFKRAQMTMNPKNRSDLGIANSDCSYLSPGALCQNGCCIWVFWWILPTKFHSHSQHECSSPK